jgi:hypothetical protein
MIFQEAITNLFFTMVISFMIVWVLIFWGLGIINFKIKYSKSLGFIGECIWYIVIGMHIIAIYYLWFTDIQIKLIFGVLILANVFYGMTFARNISAR